VLRGSGWNPVRGGAKLPVMRALVREVIFGTQTRAGRLFDVALIVLIIVSLLTISLESVASIAAEWGTWLRAAEWGITVLFTLEYVLRLWCVDRPWAYARSFFGVVDLLSIVPGYAALFVSGSQSLLAIRALRVLRIFRVLKLARFVGEADLLMRALAESRHKIVVFLGGVLCVVVLVGAVMHLVEGPEHGFTSIPSSMYWAIVTMTTVGYGDIAPETPLGQALAALVMILGYGVLAVPTGIVSAELVHVGRQRQPAPRPCPGCGLEDHATDAAYCRRCGAALGEIRAP
jgi:voltage-gated potassium channel